MKAGRCPQCNSTDVTELVVKNRGEKDCGCLDCGFTWMNGGRRRRDR